MPNSNENVKSLYCGLLTLNLLTMSCTAVGMSRWTNAFFFLILLSFCCVSWVFNTPTPNLPCCPSCYQDKIRPSKCGLMITKALWWLHWCLSESFSCSLVTHTQTHSKTKLFMLAVNGFKMRTTMDTPAAQQRMCKTRSHELWCAL